MLAAKTNDDMIADICQQRHTKSEDFYKKMQDIQQGLLQTKLLQCKKHFDLCKIVLQHNFTQFKVLIGMLFKALDFVRLRKSLCCPFVIDTFLLKFQCTLIIQCSDLSKGNYL